MGMNICEMVETNECTEFEEHESLYCCEYISDYQYMYIFLIRIVVYTDMTDVILSSLAILIAFMMRIFKIGPTGSGIYIMALSTLITAIATFIMVGLVTINDLIGTAQQIYEYGCFDRKNIELVLGLKDEFASIIWVDALNGCVDIIALIILIFGVYFSNNNNVDEAGWNVPSKLIYIVLYVLRLAISYISYFRTELPAYRNFIDAQQNPDALCYKVYHVSDNHHLAGSQTVL